MNDRRTLSLIFSLLLCAVVWAVLLSTTDGPVAALTADRYVAPGGSDLGGCTLPTSPCRTVQYAVDVATPGDVVKVAAGLYDDLNSHGGLSQVVYISKTLTIQGGYTTDFSGPPDPETNPTELDALGQGRVVFATGPGVDVTLEGLRLTRGSATGLAPASAGGGFHAEQVRYLFLHKSRVYSNTADIGGGIYVHACHSSGLDALQVYSNTAREGGGVYFHNTGDSTLVGSQIFANTSGWNGAGIYVGSGYYDTKLSFNTIHENVAGNAGGAGLFIRNTNAPWIYGNTIYSNTAEAQGSGLHLDGTRDAIVISNTILHNAADTNGGGLFIRDADRSLVAQNEIAGNTTKQTGAGIQIYGSDDARLEDNHIHDNASTLSGGGVYIATCKNLGLSRNIIHGNTSGDGGGLYCSNATAAQISGNQVYDNTGPNGGGIYLYGGADLWLANNLIWGNQATVRGAGILANRTSARLLHSTIARNHGTGDGVSLYAGATLTLANTILVSHTTGIWVPAGCTATLEATLWGTGTWANTTDWLVGGTLLTGTLNSWAGPGFVDPEFHDYHILPDSAAVDAGIIVGVRDDIDGEVRDWCYPDLGVDEVPGGRSCRRTHLPLILRSAP